MKIISPSDYERIRPLFAPLPYLIIDSVMAGLTPATVYTDDLDAPQTAVIWAGRKVLLGGIANEAIAITMQELLTTTYLENGFEWAILACTSTWQEHILNLLPSLEHKSAKRLYYQLDARAQEWTSTIPENMELLPVDANLLANPELKNLDWVTEELVSERPSIADFLAKSFGYCVVHDQEIIAWCMSEYNCGTRCELGIATAEHWQRQGLARLTATAVIGNKRRSTWNTMISAGFVGITIYPLYKQQKRSDSHVLMKICPISIGPDKVNYWSLMTNKRKKKQKRKVKQQQQAAQLAEKGQKKTIRHNVAANQEKHRLDWQPLDPR